MSLNPVLTSQKIFERYVSYITTTFHLKDKELNNQIYTALKEESKFFKGPIIEATPPFLKGKTIEKLIKDGTLTQEFYNLQAKSLPLDRNLYLHQEESILKICKEKDDSFFSIAFAKHFYEIFNFTKKVIYNTIFFHFLILVLNCTRPVHNSCHCKIKLI